MGLWGSARQVSCLPSPQFSLFTVPGWAHQLGSQVCPLKDLHCNSNWNSPLGWVDQGLTNPSYEIFWKSEPQVNSHSENWMENWRVGLVEEKRALQWAWGPSGQMTPTVGGQEWPANVTSVCVQSWLGRTFASKLPPCLSLPQTPLSNLLETLSSPKFSLCSQSCCPWLTNSQLPTSNEHAGHA